MHVACLTPAIRSIHQLWFNLTKICGLAGIILNAANWKTGGRLRRVCAAQLQLQLQSWRSSLTLFRLHMFGSGLPMRCGGVPGGRVGSAGTRPCANVLLQKHWPAGANAMPQQVERQARNPEDLRKLPTCCKSRKKTTWPAGWRPKHHVPRPPQPCAPRQLTDILIAQVGAGHREAACRQVCGLVVRLKAVLAELLAAWPLQRGARGGEAQGGEWQETGCFFSTGQLKWVLLTGMTCATSAPPPHPPTFIRVEQSSPVQPAGQRHQPRIASHTPAAQQKPCGQKERTAANSHMLQLHSPSTA